MRLRRPARLCITKHKKTSQTSATLDRKTPYDYAKQRKPALQNAKKTTPTSATLHDKTQSDYADQPHQILHLPHKTNVKPSKLEFCRPNPLPRAAQQHDKVMRMPRKVGCHSRKYCACHEKWRGKKCCACHGKCSYHELPRLPRNGNAREHRPCHDF